MPGAALALVLTAAVLHSAWNALTKRAHNPLCFLWLASSLSGLVYLPLAVARLVTDGLPVPAVPYVLATILLHALYFYALGRSYGSGEFSVVYPIARGLGVALVPLLALPLFGERLSRLGAIGVGLVVAGIVALQVASRGWRTLWRRVGHGGTGTWWALLTGLTIASYSLVDKAGVARLHPVPYITLMFLGMNAVLVPVVLAEGEVRREWARNRSRILLAALMTSTAYVLVLFAFQISKAGYVVAGREVSIVLSALIGGVLFKEGRVAPRLAGAAVVLAGVVCVALAR
jgi:drug/metabolite transporter (DMT)-like permease